MFLLFWTSWRMMATDSVLCDNNGSVEYNSLLEITSCMPEIDYLDDILQNSEYFAVIQRNGRKNIIVCVSYNKGSGEYGNYPDKEACNRLHVCENYIRGICEDTECSRSHDFYEPHPMKTLQGKGVPSQLMGSLYLVYRNILALRHRNTARDETVKDNTKSRNKGKVSESLKSYAENIICLSFIKGYCKFGGTCIVYILLRVLLSPSDKDYIRVQEHFKKALKYSILRIERVQNKELWEDFQTKRARMKKANKDMKYGEGERLLFHGTKSSLIDAICRENFNMRVSGANGTVYGQGSYFARDAKYCHSYTDKCGWKSMFACRVLVGQYTKGESHYRRPPARDGAGGPYDSCVNDVQDRTIYVVFKRPQVYTEFLITYKEDTFTGAYGGSVNSVKPSLSGYAVHFEGAKDLNTGSSYNSNSATTTSQSLANDLQKSLSDCSLGSELGADDFDNYFFKTLSLYNGRSSASNPASSFSSSSRFSFNHTISSSLYNTQRPRVSTNPQQATGYRKPSSPKRAQKSDCEIRFKLYD